MSLFNRKTATREELENEVSRLMKLLELDEGKKRVEKEVEHTLTSWRDQARSFIHDHDWDDQYERLSRQARHARARARECVSEHPVTTIALAAGAIAVVGLLLSRRR